MDLALKRVGPDTVEGWAIPFGVDTDGEQFTKDTDFAFEWFGKSGRPLLYEHGLQRPGVHVIGRQDDYEERADGIWAQAELERHKRYRREVDRLLEEGALGFSSGAMPHLAKVRKSSGIIERWPWVELSLTPIPAHPATLNVHYVKSADFLSRLDGDDTTLSIAAVKAIAAGLTEGDPDPASLDDKAGRVSAAVDDFRAHVRQSAEMRSKAGRVLSAANRERIARALASREAVLEAYADLETLLSETDPETAAKATDLLWLERLAFERTEARLLGVPMT